MRHSIKQARLESRLARLRAGTVRVELLAARPAQARALVARRGGRVEAAYRDLVEARVPVGSLRALARDASVRYVSEPARPVPEAVRGQAVQYARAHGIQIISHSVSWLNTSRGDGAGAADSPEGIVPAARSAGILWVNAAGNRARQHWSGTFTDANANGWNEFAPGDEGNTITLPAGAFTCIALKWDDSPASAEDYDLYLTRPPDGAVVASSTNPQTGTQPPTELTCRGNGSGVSETYAIGIRTNRTSGRPLRFDL